MYSVVSIQIQTCFIGRIYYTTEPVQLVTEATTLQHLQLPMKSDFYEYEQSVVAISIVTVVCPRVCIFTSCTVDSMHQHCAAD